MIQVFHIHAPLGSLDPAPVVTVVHQALEQLQRRHPALRGAQVQAVAGELQLQLRCYGTDRWKVSRAARTVASAMLRRAKLDPGQAQIVSIVTEPDAKGLRGEERVRFKPEPVPRSQR